MLKRILVILSLSLLWASHSYSSLTDSEETQPIQRYYVGHPKCGLEDEGLRFELFRVGHPECGLKFEGLSGNEETHRWSCEKKVTFQIPLDGRVRSLVFENVGANGDQVAEVFLNERFLKEHHFSQKVPQQSIIVDLPECSHSLAFVEFMIPDACVPGRFDPNNKDPRTLGLSFQTIALYDLPDPVFKGCHNVDFSFFPVGRIQRFKAALVELEIAIQAYAIAHNCDRNSIWDEHSTILIRLHNSATTACHTARYVENLMCDWKSGDPDASQPIDFGRENWNKSVKFQEVEDLHTNARGKLKEELDQEIELAKAFIINQMEQFIRELAAGEGETKQVAIDLLKLVPYSERIEEKRNTGEELTADEAEIERLSKNYINQLRELSDKFPSHEGIMERFNLKKRPVFNEIVRVIMLAKSFSLFKITL